MKTLISFLIIILLTAQSCDQKKSIKQYYYFDIEGFFTKEAERLQNINPQVNKQVIRNNQSEKQTIMIEDWKTELELFIASDINKPAWKDNYIIQQNEQIIAYTAKDPDLRTRKIIIYYKNRNKTPEHIYIINRVKNSLYYTTEELNYYPDSLYRIEKKQNVRLIGTNNYIITGKINEYSSERSVSSCM